MTHPRQLIREAIADIVGGTPTRLRPTQDNELPARLVYVLSEDNEALRITSREQKRIAKAIIEIRVAGTAGCDDVLDGYAESIEAAMAADPKLAGTAANSRLTGTSIGLDPKPETPQAVMSLAYDVTYLG